MSYISRKGRLGGPVRLTSREDGTILGHALVIVNDRVRDDDGNWYDAATTAYALTVKGRAAVRLAEFQERNGNAAVVFSGDYSVRTYTAPDGTTRLSHDVWVDTLGADLMTHDLDVRQATEPDQSPTDAHESNPWTQP